tara:strand:+ start:2136 stop:2729 length:594 start_codon:yes stop_codon:yes gene_type:complete
MIKRIFDLIVGIVVTTLLLPLGLIIFILIRVFMGYPTIFKQKRPGYKEKIFTLYKFRTMNNKKNSKNLLLPDDKRTTVLGKILRKTSLDELPSLINLLKGEMSLVGPRPLLPQYLKYYSDEQKRRHNVRPGITGWAQINGRNELNWSQKFDLDIWYVDNQSFYLDLKILLLTIIKVLRFEGINAKGNKPVKEFKGNN